MAVNKKKAEELRVELQAEDIIKGSLGINRVKTMKKPM
jgi:hypothetical protein